MRPVSLKRQRRNREAKQVHDDFRSAFPNCMVCGRLAEHVHEISRGPARDKSLDQLCALLSLCSRCHDEIHATWSLQQEYVLKALADTENFDRVMLNRLRGRDDDAIDERELWCEARTVLERIQ